MFFRGFEMINEQGETLTKCAHGNDLIKAHVAGYTRSDGTYVRAHEDNRPAARQKPSMSKHDEWLKHGKTEVEGHTIHRGKDGEHHVSKNGKQVGSFHYDDGPLEQFVYSGGHRGGETPFEDMDSIGPVLKQHHGRHG